jgi:hypothetical protein
MLAGESQPDESAREDDKDASGRCMLRDERPGGTLVVLDAEDDEKGAEGERVSAMKREVGACENDDAENGDGLENEADEEADENEEDEVEGENVGHDEENRENDDKDKDGEDAGEKGSSVEETCVRRMMEGDERSCVRGCG